MPHMLAVIRASRPEEFKKLIINDAPQHAEEGLHLEHFWINEDDREQVLFLFRADDLKHARNFISRVHTEALKENPGVNLPEMTYLIEI